ncbi:nuclease-related domain-containing protein [Paenibacillus sp. PL2-23]|uniref:nuclease-related domain-containing protein n=1 Tax=Paenibacillus sp. PL2-23 TaxID=2100729 RepID=UPI0030FCD765
MGMADILVRENTLIQKFNEAEREKTRLSKLPLLLIAVGGMCLPISVVAIVLIHWSFVALSVASLLCLGMGVWQWLQAREQQERFYDVASDSPVAGIEGRMNTIHALRRLPAGWKVISDVSIPSGSEMVRADFVVVSEKGIWCIDVKHVNGELEVDPVGGTMTQRKSGKGGVPYVQSAGNPIGETANAAARLEAYLQDQGVSDLPAIHGVVYFSHDAATVTVTSSMERIAVLQGERALLSYLDDQTSPQAVTLQTQEQVVGLLWRK